MLKKSLKYQRNLLKEASETLKYSKIIPVKKPFFAKLQQCYFNRFF